MKKLLAASSLFWLASISGALAQTTLLGNIPTNTTTPLVAGDCFYVSQGTSGSTGTDTKLCPGSAVAFAAAMSAAAVANNLSDLASVATAAQNLLNGLCVTQGSVLYKGASSWACLSPGTSGQFLETLGAGANPLWATAVVGPAYHTIAISGSTFTPNLNLGSNFIVTLTSACPCTLANFANLTTGNAYSGVIRVIQSAAGGASLTVSGSQYAFTTTPPLVQDPTANNDWLYYVDAAGNIQFTQALLPPSLSSTVANQLLGGDTMASSWTTNGATLTAGPSGLAPDGTNNAAFITEDTSTGTHRAAQTGSFFAGTNTVSVFALEKTGTRWVEMRFTDNTVANAASMTFDPVSCTVKNTAGTIGDGVILATGVINRPNGYCEGWMQVTITPATPAFVFVEMSTPSGDNYAGDGISAIYLWRPAARVGALSPP